MPRDDPAPAERPGAADRRAYRAWLLAHHPDAGGDPESFVAGLPAWRRRLQGPPAGRPPGTPAPVVVFRARGGLWQVERWWRRFRAARRVH